MSACDRRGSSSHARKNLWYPGYPTTGKTTKTRRELKKYSKPNWSKKMPEEEHEKKLTRKHYTTMRMKTNRQDSNVYLKFLFSRELVVSPVVQAHHFTALALERQVLEPLTSAASELHRSVEAFFIRGVLC